MCIAQFMGTLKSKSALMIFDRHANLKYKYRGRNFWCRGPFVDSRKGYEEAPGVYPMEEDLASGQMSRKGYMDPFTDSRRK